MLRDYELKLPQGYLREAFQAARWLFWLPSRHYKGYPHYKPLRTKSPGRIWSADGRSYGSLLLPACVLPWNLAPRRKA